MITRKFSAPQSITRRANSPDGCPSELLFQEWWFGSATTWRLQSGPRRSRTTWSIRARHPARVEPKPPCFPCEGV